MWYQIIYLEELSPYSCDEKAIATFSFSEKKAKQKLGKEFGRIVASVGSCGGEAYFHHFGKVNTTCMIFGHKWDEYDGLTCDRCGEFYYGYKPAWIIKLNNFIYLNITMPIRMRLTFTRCIDCGKLDEAFGKPVGNHDDCLPF